MHPPLALPKQVAGLKPHEIHQPLALSKRVAG